MEAPTWVQLNEDMKAAMRAKDAEKLQTIRMLIAALKNLKIELRRDVTEEEITDLLATEVKKRRDAIRLYTEGNRPELAAKEESEIELIQNYLPKQLTDDEVAAMVDEAIAQSGAASKKDMGKVMGIVVPQTKGRFDGSKIKDIVIAKLP